MIEISKELLSKILNDELSIVNADSILCKLKESTLIIKCEYLKTKLTPTFSYNIYELANKCKEWANNQSSTNLGYAIKTVHYGNNVVGGFAGIEDSFIDDCKTEYELVFKLCQWILDNKA